MVRISLKLHTFLKLLGWEDNWYVHPNPKILKSLSKTNLLIWWLAKWDVLLLLKAYKCSFILVLASQSPQFIWYTPHLYNLTLLSLFLQFFYFKLLIVLKTILELRSAFTKNCLLKKIHYLNFFSLYYDSGTKNLTKWIRRCLKNWKLSTFSHIERKLTYGFSWLTKISAQTSTGNVFASLWNNILYAIYIKTKLREMKFRRNYISIM